MKLLLNLILRDAWQHRSRIALAVIATTAMSAMIVWIIGSLDLMMLKFDEDAENYLGQFHLAIVPEKNQAFPQSIIDELQKDDLVVQVVPAVQIKSVIGKMNDETDTDAALRRERSLTGLPTQSPAVIGIDVAESPFVLQEGRWFDVLTSRPSPLTPPEGIIGTAAAQSLQDWGGKKSEPVQVGDTIICRVGTNDYPIKIVGLVEQNLAAGSRTVDPAVGAVYVSMQTAQEMLNIAAHAGVGYPSPSEGGLTNVPSPLGGRARVGAELVNGIAPTLTLPPWGEGTRRNPPSGGEGTFVVTPHNKEGTKNKGEGTKDRIDYIYVQLREGADTKQLSETWKKHFAAQNIALTFHDIESIQHRLNQTRSRNTAGLIGGPTTLASIILFSTLVSVLIVFTALSMGITERTRTFAMLRTVGMPRWKIAVLVFGESLILCSLGWLGGMLAGWAVLQLTITLQPQIFGEGKTVALGIMPIVIAGLAALAGSLLAAVLPAYRATRISPLEGMNRSFAHSVNTRWFVLAAMVGTALLFVNPILVYTDWFAEFSVTTAGQRLFQYTYIGIPTQIFGCLLLVPCIILLVERFGVSIIAPVFRLPKELLQSQLSSNLWRTIGTTLALCIGLGVYSFLEISGYSMLVPYIQSKDVPEVLAAFLPSGIPMSEIEAVKNTPGINPNRFLTLAVDQSHFSPQQADRFMQNGMIKMQTSAVVFGVDVEQAFGTNVPSRSEEGLSSVPSPPGGRVRVGAMPLTRSAPTLALPPRGEGTFNNPPSTGEGTLSTLPFIEGTLETALQKLRTNKRYCLVPDSFAHRADVHVGDKLELVLPTREPATVSPTSSFDTAGTQSPALGRETVEYEICGIVSIHGWLWMNKISGVRTRGYRSGAMLIAPIDVVKQDYQIDDASFFWFDRQRDAQGKPMISDNELEKSLQQLAEKYAPNNAGVSRPMVKVSSREYLTDRVSARSDEVIQAAAVMPLILLAISSFGMMGTMAASVRSRRYEFGVLRCLGITRFGLMRLILAEALLIALTVIVISIGFGIIGAWCFIGLMKYVAGFGGFTSPLTLPMNWLALGFAVALIFCSLAALGPAFAAGRSSLTRLLRDV